MNFQKVVRVAALAILLIIVGMNLMDLKNRLTPDEDPLPDVRLADMRQLLPKEGYAGYLSDAPPVNALTDLAAVKKFYLTQYALVPLVIRPGTQDEFIIANFSDPHAAAIQMTGLTLVKDFGGGLMLLRKKTY